MRGNPVSYTAT